MNVYCRRDDVFTGYGAAGVVAPPPDRAGDITWLATHCWVCGDSAGKIRIEQDQRPTTENPLALPWRTGRHLGRTLYAQAGPSPGDGDVFLGMMDTPALAQEVCRAHNVTLMISITASPGTLPTAQPGAAG